MDLSQPYYHYSTHDIYFGAGTGSHIKVPAPLGSLPALHRGGSILPRRDLVRRAATLAWRDPITLVAALDITGTTATGSLYLDDGESYANEKGEFIWRGFTIEPVVDAPSKRLILRSRSLQPASTEDGVTGYDPSGNAWAKKIADVKVGKVIVLGLLSRPSNVRYLKSGSCIAFSWTDGVAATAGRRRGGAGKRSSELVFDLPYDMGLVVEDWEFAIEYGTPRANVELLEHAAPTGDFLCRNEGHIPASILRSRVNDGVCDPECCDGSDETDGKAHCPNRCKEVGEAYRKEVEEEGRKNRVGGAVRKEYITFGIKEKKKLEDEVDKLSREIEKLEEREKVAKVALDVIESAEAGDIERKKNSVLYQRITEMQTAIKALRTHRSNLEAHVSDLSGILGDLSVRPLFLWSFSPRLCSSFLSPARLQPQLPGHGRAGSLSRVQGLAEGQRHGFGRGGRRRRSSCGPTACSRRRRGQGLFGSRAPASGGRGPALAHRQPLVARR